MSSGSSAETPELPKLLLLTRTPPGYRGVGGVFLQELWNAYPPSARVCFTLARNRWQVPGPELAGDWARVSRHSVPELPGPLTRIASAALRAWKTLVEEPWLSQQIVRLAHRQRIDAVWAILNDPATIALSARVAERLGVPLFATVWDPPQAVADKAGLGPEARQRLYQGFEKALRLSRRCGVASESMAEDYRSRFGIEPVVLIHGPDEKLWRPPAPAPSSQETIIGFAGSVYARTEWRALLQTLEDAGWDLDGRPVRILLLGHENDFFDEWREHVEVSGWQSMDRVVEMLSTADVLYLPYWLGPAHTESTRLCFPNKLPTYLAAGRPVLFHGPRDSTPARFFARHPVGVTCHSLDPEEILHALRRLLGGLGHEPGLYHQATLAGREALRSELGLATFRHRFAQLLGVSEGSLETPSASLGSVTPPGLQQRSEVSIVIPARDRSALLHRALESVRAQTWQRFEAIVVDDGSTEDLRAVVSSLGDSRVRYVQQEPAGAAVARNLGASKARGKYLVFLDSDDEARSHWLERLVAVAEAEAAPLVFCGMELRDDTAGTSETMLPVHLGPLFNDWHGTFLAGAFFLTRSLFESVGGYREELAANQHTELGIRLVDHGCKHGWKPAQVREVLVVSHRHDGARIRKDPRAVLQATEHMLEHYRERLQRYPGDYLDYLAVAGTLATRLGETSRARRHLLEAIRYRPWRLKSSLRLLRTFLPRPAASHRSEPSGRSEP